MNEMLLLENGKEFFIGAFNPNSCCVSHLFSEGINAKRLKKLLNRV
jgi:hypothetical protein